MAALEIFIQTIFFYDLQMSNLSRLILIVEISFDLKRKQIDFIAWYFF